MFYVAMKALGHLNGILPSDQLCLGAEAWEGLPRDGLGEGEHGLIEGGGLIEVAGVAGVGDELQAGVGQGTAITGFILPKDEIVGAVEDECWFFIVGQRGQKSGIA